MKYIRIRQKRHFVNIPTNLDFSSCPTYYRENIKLWVEVLGGSNYLQAINLCLANPGERNISFQNLIANVAAEMLRRRCFGEDVFCYVRDAMIYGGTKLNITISSIYKKYGYSPATIIRENKWSALPIDKGGGAGQRKFLK